jgi:hypothetical protein
MAAAIRVQVISNAIDDPEAQLHHRFLNFGEDVYRALRDICTVNLAEVDRAYDHFVVRDIRRRDIGTVNTLLKRVIRHHRLLDDVILVRVDRSDSGRDSADPRPD